MNSPTQRSLKELRDDGWTAAVVEHFVRFPPPGHRVDLFGCIDILAIRRDQRFVLGIQATTSSNCQARVVKSMGIEALKTWLSSGNRFEVWGWGKRGKRGCRKLWTLRKKVIKISEGELNVTEGYIGAPGEGGQNI